MKTTLGTRPTTDSCISIDTSFLKSLGCFSSEVWEGLLWWNRNEKEKVIPVNIDAQNTDLILHLWHHEKRCKYWIPILTTPCHFGGVRHWFMCPTCHKRVRKVYQNNDNTFACRTCLGLCYKSQNLGGWEKELGKVHSYPSIKRLRETMRPYYDGKPTQKHLRYHKRMTRFSTYIETSIQKQNSILS